VEIVTTNSTSVV